MSDVITFFFSLLAGIWNLIISNWILSVFVLITVFNMIISIVNMTSKNDSDK